MSGGGGQRDARIKASAKAEGKGTRETLPSGERIVVAEFEPSGTERLIEALRAMSGEAPQPRQRRRARYYLAASLLTIVVVSSLVWWWASREAGGRVAATRARAKLTITADQPEVEIEVDGNAVGRAPLEVEVPEGEHLIEAISATARVRESVRVHAGARRALELEFPKPEHLATSLDSDALEPVPNAGASPAASGAPASSAPSAPK